MNVKLYLKARIGKKVVQKSHWLQKDFNFILQSFFKTPFIHEILFLLLIHH